MHSKQLGASETHRRAAQGLLNPEISFEGELHPLSRHVYPDVSGAEAASSIDIYPYGTHRNEKALAFSLFGNSIHRGKVKVPCKPLEILCPVGRQI